MTVDLTKFAVDGGTRPDAITGLNPQFQSALVNMFAAAPPEIQAQLRISSGYRSPEVQAQLYKNALAKYGSEAEARRWVAPPGHSQHNHGYASDLRYLSPEAQQWAHANAAQYGLAFPLANENWHIELAGARGGQPMAVQNAVPAGGAAPGSPGLFAPPADQATAPQMAAPAQVDPNAMLAAMFAQSASRATSRRVQDEKAAAEKARRAALFAPMG